MLLHPSFFGLLQLPPQLNIKVSAGQIIPPHAFRYFMHKTGLDKLLSEKLKRIGKDRDEQMLATCSRQFQKIIADAAIPMELSAQLYECYFMLEDKNNRGHQSIRLQSVVEPLLNISAYPLTEEHTVNDIDGPAALLEAVHQAFAKVFTSRMLEVLINDPDSAGFLPLFIGMHVQPVFTDEVFGTCYRLLGPSAHIITLHAAYGNPAIYERALSGADSCHVEERKGRLNLSFLEARNKTKMWLTPGSRLLEPAIIEVPSELQNRLCVDEGIIMKIVRAFLKIESGMKARQLRLHCDLLWKVNRDTNQPELLDIRRF